MLYEIVIMKLVFLYSYLPFSLWGEEPLVIFGGSFLLWGDGLGWELLDLENSVRLLLVFNVP